MADKPFVVRSHDIHTDNEYASWISDVKERFRHTQIKAAIKVNSEQLLFNWQLGRDLVVRRAEERWGRGVVEQVSLDLQDAFPQVKGFSTTNLWYMKKWYLFYSKDPDTESMISEMEKEINLESIKLHQVGGEAGDEKLHQVGGEMNFPQLFAFVPWRHHVEIITKCKSATEALYYIRRTIEEGWSRAALVNCIEADFFHKQGTAVTNFKEKLSSAQGRLAQEIVKDTYDLSFVSLPPEYDEKALETALEHNITRFLLELGVGFSFVGRQKEIVVAGKTRKIDMLFYHIRLKCYVVVELKAKPFEPEFAGKLNFYVNAVDDLIRTPDENPTIGLLICRDKDKAEVQWAFRGITTPMGVASYGNITVEDVKAQLPTEEQIQERIKQTEEEFRKERNKDNL